MIHCLKKQNNTTKQARSVESRVLGKPSLNLSPASQCFPLACFIRFSSLPRQWQSVRRSRAGKRAAVSRRLLHSLGTLSSLLGQPAAPAVEPTVPWDLEISVLSFQRMSFMSRWRKKCGEDEGTQAFQTPLKQCSLDPYLREPPYLQFQRHWRLPSLRTLKILSVVLILFRFVHCPHEVWVSQISSSLWVVHFFKASALSYFGLFSCSTILGDLSFEDILHCRNRFKEWKRWTQEICHLILDPLRKSSLFMFFWETHLLIGGGESYFQPVLN